MGNLQLVRHVKTVVWWGIVIVLLAVGAMRISDRLNRAYSRKEFQAKLLIGTILRMNQAYFLENSKFSNSVAELETWKKYKLVTEETLHSWEIQKLPGSQPMITITAVPNVLYRDRLRSFSAATRQVENAPLGTLDRVICRTEPFKPPAKFENRQGRLACPQGSERLDR
jgi:hypothetical protein